MRWPKQSECINFYGNPRYPRFEVKELIHVDFPWMAVTSWDGKRVKAAQVHRRCAESLHKILWKIWELSGKSQEVINDWGLNKFGGGYNFRNMREKRSLSMHAYGCAIDIDPDRNQRGNSKPNFEKYPEIVKIFEDEGWVWGGRWKGKDVDGMHFQAANP